MAKKEQVVHWSRRWRFWLCESGSMPLLVPPSRPFFYYYFCWEQKNRGTDREQSREGFPMPLDRLPCLGYLIRVASPFTVTFFFLLSFFSPSLQPSFLLPTSSLSLFFYLFLCFLFIHSSPLLPSSYFIHSRPSSTMCKNNPTNPNRVVLPTNVTPSHYTLTITPDLKEYTFSGYVEIK